MNIKKKMRKHIVFLLVVAMVFSMFPFGALASSDGMNIEQPVLVITGNGIIGDSYASGVSNETSYTLAELKALAGDENRYIYSSNNSSGTKEYLLADGIKLETLLNKSGIADISAITVKAVSNDNRAESLNLGEARYYLPNLTDEIGKTEVPAILGWASATGTTVPTDTIEQALRLYVGQLNVDDSNKSKFNKNINKLEVGDAVSEIVLTVGETAYTRADILLMARADRSYTYSTSSGNNTDYVRGVPMSVLLEGVDDNAVVNFTAADGYDMSSASMTKKALVDGNYMLAYEKGTSAADLVGIYETAKKGAEYGYGFLTMYGDGAKPAKMVNGITVEVAAEEPADITILGVEYSRDEIVAMGKTVASYTYSTKGGEKTDYVRGVPLMTLLEDIPDNAVILFDTVDGYAVDASGMTKAELVDADYILAYQVGTSETDLADILDTDKNDETITGCFRLYGTGAGVAKMVNVIAVDQSNVDEDAVQPLVIVTGTGVGAEKSYTLDELKAIAAADESAYENNLYQYSALNTSETKKLYLGEGVRIDTLLSLSGVDNFEQIIKLTAGDGYGATFDPEYTSILGPSDPNYKKTLTQKFTAVRYYYPNYLDNASIEGGSEVPSILAWASANVGLEASATEIPSVPTEVGAENGTVTLMTGQLAANDYNNPIYVSDIQRIQVGQAVTETAITIANTPYTRAQILLMPRSEEVYTYSTKGGEKTDYVRGVSMKTLLADYNDTDVISFEAADGYDMSSKTMTKAELIAGNYMLAYEIGESAGAYENVYDTAKDDNTVYGYFRLYGGEASPSKLVNKITVKVVGGIDFVNSPYKHITNGGQAGSAPYNVDSITSCTLTVEGPGVKTSVPVSVRELENTNKGLYRGTYTDETGTFNYEGLQLSYLLTQMKEGTNGIVLTDKAYKVELKDCNRKTIAEFIIDDVLNAETPVILAYGIGKEDDSKALPFVFNGATSSEHSPGYDEELKNDDGCLRLVYKLDSITNKYEYVKFTNVAYVYVSEETEPGFKHDEEPYNSKALTSYVMTFRGEGLGREINVPLSWLEALAEYDENNKPVENGLAFRDWYSLTNTTYWPVNEYEGIKLYDLLLYLGVDKEMDGETEINFTSRDNYPMAPFTFYELAHPELFGYYEKNPEDKDDGTYEPKPEDLIKTGYPVLLAYGVNSYPYVMGNGDDGYLSGLSNDGGPLRVIFGKRYYSESNGSNQLQRLNGVIVGDDTYKYNTHKYTDTENELHAAQNALAQNAISITVLNEDGETIKNITTTVGDIEDLIYADGVSAANKAKAQVKNYYQLAKGSNAYSDMYEGVNLYYYLTEIVQIPGIKGTVTFKNAENQTLVINLEDLVEENGYNTETGISGLKSGLMFAKNGSPMVPDKTAAGYEKEFSLGTSGETFTVKNDGGPIAVLIPSTDATTFNGKALQNVTSIEINLVTDKYAHLEEPYAELGETTITVFGEGTSLAAPKTYTVAELEAKQTLAFTGDYSFMNSRGVVSELRYRGINLYKFLSLAEIGRKTSADKVILTSSDGSTVELTLADIIKTDYINSLDETVTELPVILAYGSASADNENVEDGKPLVKEKTDEGYDEAYQNNGGPLKLVIGQVDAEDKNKSKCLSDIVSIEVTASEQTSWKHKDFDVMEQYLDYEFKLIVENDDSSYTKTYTLAELEELSAFIMRDQYEVLNLGEIEGLDLWKFIEHEVGQIEGFDDLISITPMAPDGWGRDLIAKIGKDKLIEGMENSQGIKKPVILAYAINGMPMVDSETSDGFNVLYKNADGPLRVIVEGTQDACGKWTSQVVIKIPGSGEIVNPADEKEYLFKYFKAGGIEGLPNASVRDVQIDANGGMWVGTNGGGAYYKPADSDVFTISTLTTEGYVLKSDVVQAIAIDKEGGVWFSQAKSYTDLAGNAGAAYLAPDGTITYFDTSTPGTIPHNYVQEIKIDDDGNVWFGSFGGLTRYNPATNEWRTWTDEDGMPALSVDNIEFDNKGGVWVGNYPNAASMTGPFSGGYAHINAQGEVDFAYNADQDGENEDLLADYWVRDIAVDSMGGAWIVRSGSYSYLENVGGRLDYVDRDGNITHYTGKELLGDKLTGNSEIRMVQVDPDGGLWLGTWNGVFYFNFMEFSAAKESWPEGMDNVYSMDFVGNTLYVGSNGGVAYHEFAFEGKTIERLYGNTRFDTSANISAEMFEDDSADAIVIVDGMNFPDALAAAAFASKVNAPILMINGATGEISDAVKAEINRIDRDHNAKIYIIGGKIAVSENAETVLKDIGYTDGKISRIYGGTRFETAVELAKRQFDADTAYIVNGMDYPDALSIGDVAAINNGVVLFTKSNKLPEETAAYLKTAGFDNIVIVGGELAVGAEVEAELKNICGNVSRISGANRVATSVAIAEEYFPVTDTIYIATGFSFADALSGGPLAASDNAPILLVNTVKNELAPEVAEYIKNSGVRKIVVLGGENAVSAEIYAELEELLK